MILFEQISVQWKWRGVAVEFMGPIDDVACDRLLRAFCGLM